MPVGVRRTSVRRTLDRCLSAALCAVDPVHALRHQVRFRNSILSVGPHQYDLRRVRRVVVVGAGKAAAPMAREMERLLGRRLTAGFVVTKYGHRVPTRRIEVLEAGHPVPDAAGAGGAARVLAIARSLSSRDLLIVLVSGGASALLPAPAEGLSLIDKQETTQLLLKSGATIQEVNAVRKHLSALKGGQLAVATKARVVSVILSDVLGDDLASIGSGLTAPDPTTFVMARAILKRYRLWEKLPQSVRRHVARGCRGQVRETPKSNAAVFRQVHNVIIGNNQAAVDTAARTIWKSGLTPFILTTTLTGEARDAARAFGALAKQIVRRGRPAARPCCLLAGGELTVRVRGNGVGGRAQEFALAAAKEIAGLKDVWIVGIGTDGTDGPTDAAGAVVDGTTWETAIARKLNPQRALAHHDAHPLLQRMGLLIHTGPTGTNVNDLYLLLAS